MIHILCWSSSASRCRPARTPGPKVTLFHVPPSSRTSSDPRHVSHSHAGSAREQTQCKPSLKPCWLTSLWPMQRPKPSKFQIPRPDPRWQRPPLQVGHSSLHESPWILTTHESSAQNLSVLFCASSFSSELLWQNFLQVYHPPEIIIINRQSLKQCAWSQDFSHPPLNIPKSDPFLKSPRHLFWWWTHTRNLEQPVLLSASTTAQDRNQDTAEETPSHIQVTPTQYSHHCSPLGKPGRNESEEGSGVAQCKPRSSRSHRIFTTPGISVNCWSFQWGLNLQVKQNQKPKYLDCELSVCKALTHLPLWSPVIDIGKPPWLQNGRGRKASLVSTREMLK